jgi:hypothetical protein
LFSVQNSLLAAAHAIAEGFNAVPTVAVNSLAGFPTFSCNAGLIRAAPA